MNKLSFIIAILFFIPFSSYSQDSSSYVLSGTVVNGASNSVLIGANLVSSRKIGTKTDEIGDFNITIFPNDTLKISYIGFKTLQYIAPIKESGKYLIKFKMYRDSVSLSEVEIFPWPSYKEFKTAFLKMNKEKEKVTITGVNTYVDKNTTVPKPTVLNPASYIYDKLFDKKAKMRRRLARRRKTIKKAKADED